MAMLGRWGALGKTLLVDHRPADALVLSGRNIPGLKIVDPTQVNVYDVLDCKTLLVSQEALAKLEERLAVQTMKNLYEVIRRPLITEKSTTLKETAAHALLRGPPRRHQAGDQEGGRDRSSA